MKKNKIAVLVLILVSCLLFSVIQPIGLFAEEKSNTGQKPKVVVYNKTTQPGGYIAIYVTNTNKEVKIQSAAAFTTNKPAFYKWKNGYVSLLGVNCRTKPGTYTVRTKVYQKGKLAADVKVKVVVKPKDFDKQYLTVTKEQKALRSDENINKDTAYTDKAKAKPYAKPLWHDVFIKPVAGKISTQYGQIRYINKEESSRHAAWDIAAAKGVKVRAANDGIVKMARTLIVTGNTVIIDHGLGVFTSYGHMDKLNVKYGQKVKKGDVIGWVGSTGFSTGPHLHYTVTLGKSFIDPALLMKKDPMTLIE